VSRSAWQTAVVDESACRVGGRGGSFSGRGRVVSVWMPRRPLELAVLRQRSEREKEIEILVLQHQLRVLERIGFANSVVSLVAWPRLQRDGGSRCRDDQPLSFSALSACGVPKLR